MKKSVASGLYFVAISIGVGSFFIANICTKYLSTTAWTGVLGGILLCLPPVILISASKRRLKKDICDFLISKIVLGMLFFALSVFLCTHFTSVISLWILPDASKKIIALGLCTVLFLSLFKQRSSIFQSVCIVCFIGLISMVIVRSLIVFGGEMGKILPLFEKERINLNMLSAIWSAFAIFCVATLACLVIIKDTSPVGWGIGFGLSFVVFFLIISSCIVILGAEQTALSFDAMMLAMRESDLLGRGDLIYFIIWTLFIISTFVSVGYIPKTFIPKGSPIFYFLYSGGVFLFSLFADNIKNITQTLINVSSIGCGGALYLLAVLSLIKREGRNKNEA